jgi:membrane protease YdiL (CAAX protease family)
MNNKISIHFIAITFVTMLIGWGTLLACSRFGITLGSSAWWLYIPFMLGGWSPTIASYIVLKKHKYITGFKEWLKNIFQIKIRPTFYIFTIAMVALFYVTQILLSDAVETKPFYIFFVMLPVMLFGGGMEEAGWRYILQPELDKKYGFILSSVMTAAFWSIWHLPLFYIPGVGQYGTNFCMFAVGILGMSFSFGAIRKITGSVFLAVLAHTMTNAGYEVFIFPRIWAGTIVMAIALIIASTIAVSVHIKKLKSRIE